jgi:ubiquinone/menaquinone biosynthesis C-methylase UbiE
MAEAKTKKKRMIPAGHLGMGSWIESWSSGDIDWTPIEKKWLDNIRALVQPSGKINVVDAGSGNGNGFFPFAEKLTTDNHLVVATLIDIQPDAFDNLPDTPKNPHFPELLKLKPVVGSVVNLPIESSTQQGIFCESVLPWLGKEVDIRKTLEEFYRVLVPGGYIYIGVMSPFNNSSINGIPGKSRQERVSEIEKFISSNPDRPYLYNNPRYDRPVVYMSELVLRSFAISAGFTEIISSPVKNAVFPNGLNDDRFPDNIELLAKK